MSLVLSNTNNQNLFFNKIHKFLPNELTSDQNKLKNFDKNVEETITNFLIGKGLLGKGQSLENVNKEQLVCATDIVFIPLIEEVNRDGWNESLDLISRVFGGRLFNHDEYVDMDLGQTIENALKQREAIVQQTQSLHQNGTVAGNEEVSTLFLERLYDSNLNQELTDLIDDFELLDDLDSSNSKLGVMIDGLMEDKKWAEQVSEEISSVIQLMEDDDDIGEILEEDEFHELIGSVLNKASIIDDEAERKAFILSELKCIILASDIFIEELFESSFEKGLTIREKFIKSLSEDSMLVDNLKDLSKHYETVLNIAGNPKTDVFNKLQEKRKHVLGIKDEFVREKILAVIDTISVAYLFVEAFREDCDQHPKEFMELLTNIINYRNPNHRILFVEHLLKKFYTEKVNESSRTKLVTGLKQCSSNKKIIPTMLLSSLKDVSVSEIKKIVDTLCISADKKKQKDMNSCLHTIVGSWLKPNDTIQIFKVIVKKLQNVQSKKEKEQVILSNLNAVKALIDTKQHQRLTGCGDDTDFLKILQGEFEKTFDVSSIDDFQIKYMDTIGKFRIPTAIYTLHSSLKKLENKELPLDYYNGFVRSLLTNDFYKNRYDTSQNKHLQIVFGGNEALFNKWKEGASFESDNAKVVDTDDPEDILLCGTEVIGSCFHVDSSNTWGELGNYQYLLAYLLNGQVRMVAVKDPITNKLQSRCIIRILYDEKNKRPVLFQERLYGYKGDENLLNEMCEKRAKELGVPLVRSSTIDGSVKLHNYDSFYPQDFVDSCKFSIVGKQWKLG